MDRSGLDTYVVFMKLPGTSLQLPHSFTPRARHFEQLLCMYTHIPLLQPCVSFHLALSTRSPITITSVYDECLSATRKCILCWFNTTTRELDDGETQRRFQIQSWGLIRYWWNIESLDDLLPSVMYSETRGACMCTSSICQESAGAALEGQVVWVESTTCSRLRGGWLNTCTTFMCCQLAALFENSKNMHVVDEALPWLIKPRWIDVNVPDEVGTSDDDYCDLGGCVGMNTGKHLRLVRTFSWIWILIEYGYMCSDGFESSLSCLCTEIVHSTHVGRLYYEKNKLETCKQYRSVELHWRLLISSLDESPGDDAQFLWCVRARYAPHVGCHWQLSANRFCCVKSSVWTSRYSSFKQGHVIETTSKYKRGLTCARMHICSNYSHVTAESWLGTKQCCWYPVICLQGGFNARYNVPGMQAGWCCVILWRLKSSASQCQACRSNLIVIQFELRPHKHSNFFEVRSQVSSSVNAE